MSRPKPIIATIRAHEILDSAGWPTIEATVVLENGMQSSCSVPAGSGRNGHNPREFRDGGHRWGGRGVRRACAQIEGIVAKKLNGVRITDQDTIDARLLAIDGTPDKSKLGVNAILAVSVAAARTAAGAEKQPLYRYLAGLYGYQLPAAGERLRFPVPLITMLNGGFGADTNLDFQEFLLVPHFTFQEKQPAFRERLEASARVFRMFETVLIRKGFDTDCGGEGGYAPDMDSTVDALRYLGEAIREAGYASDREVSLGINIGGSTLFDHTNGSYQFKLEHEYLKRDQMIELMGAWLRSYPLTYLEDPLHHDDWYGCATLTHEVEKMNQDLLNDILISGGELTSSQVSRIRHAHTVGAVNTVVVKPIQVGTVTEIGTVVQEVRRLGFRLVLAGGDRETNDDFLADLAFAVSADFLKAGGLMRGERIAKYNRMLTIEEAGEY